MYQTDPAGVVIPFRWSVIVWLALSGWVDVFTLLPDPMPGLTQRRPRFAIAWSTGLSAVQLV